MMGVLFAAALAGCALDPVGALPKYGSRYAAQGDALPPVAPGTITDSRYWIVRFADYSKLDSHLLVTICPAVKEVGCTLNRLRVPTAPPWRGVWEPLPGLKSPRHVSYNDAIYLPNDEGILAAEIHCPESDCTKAVSRIVHLDKEGRHLRYLSGMANRRLPSFHPKHGLLYVGTQARADLIAGREGGSWEVYSRGFEDGAPERRITDFNSLSPFGAAPLYTPDGTVLWGAVALVKDSRNVDFNELGLPPGGTNLHGVFEIDPATGSIRNFAPTGKREFMISGLVDDGKRYVYVEGERTPVPSNSNPNRMILQTQWRLGEFGKPKSEHRILTSLGSGLILHLRLSPDKLRVAECCPYGAVQVQSVSRPGMGPQLSPSLEKPPFMPVVTPE
ncbi:MAG: hypothetical protein R3E87_21735 [Burkholderiaceae bacterium]